VITEILLNEMQRESLGEKIARLYLSESKSLAEGLEVLSAQDEEDCKKVFYTYENAAGTMATTSMYCKFTLRADRVEDFEEIIF
jgi:hypothetical protein